MGQVGQWDKKVTSLHLKQYKNGMNNHNIFLEKYKGRSTRHECPKCGDKFSFAYYIDGNKNTMIHQSVGRCNHESGCGYHYTPKEYFTDNPDMKEAVKPVMTIKQKPISKPTGTIPFKYVEQSASYNNDFIRFLCNLFDIETIERLMNDYALGATKKRDVIFWQMDIKGKVRTGKVIRYNPDTGKRVKDAGGINWVHSLMKKQGQLKEDFNLVQCLFGEHLLKMYPDKNIGLVESEKSAVIASGVYSQFIWLAAGGKSQLSSEKLNVLKGRNVVLFPDVDGFEYWTEKAKELKSICNCSVSSILEKNASREDRENKIDIADWLIREISGKHTNKIKKQLTESEKTVLGMIEKNPAMRLFIDKLDLTLIEQTNG